MSDVSAARGYLPWNPDLVEVLPRNPRDWLGEGHLAYDISFLIDQLDLSALHEEYEGDPRGAKAYHPAMMMKILVLGYSTGVFSSRRLAKKVKEDIGFRYLAAGHEVSHRTICRFRQTHRHRFAPLFTQIVERAAAIGMVKFGTLAIDGTKIRANASKRKAMSWGRMKRKREWIRAEIAARIERAEQVDAEEESDRPVDGESALPADLQEWKQRLAAYSEVDRCQAEDPELPTRSREEESAKALARARRRVENIEKAQGRLQERQRRKDRAAGRTIENEEDRQGMKDGGGSDANGKATRPFGVPEDKAQENFTDPDSRIMRTSSEGFQQCFNSQLTVDAAHQIIVDTDVVQNSNDHGQLIPMLDRLRSRYSGAAPQRLLADAGYRKEEDLKILEQRGIDGYVALGREGKKAKDADPAKLPATSRMAEKLASPQGRARYRQRKWLAEAPIGWIKSAGGFRQFSMRGLENAKAEWNLVALALNLKRMSEMGAAG